MAPHNSADAENTPSAPAHPVVGYALAPMSGASYPDPRSLRAQLAEAFETHLIKLRRERGRVCLPEDTHATIRRVHDVKEAAAAFAEAFTSLAKRADGVLAEELNEAVGENGGIPLGAMKVPHQGAIIRLAPDFSTSHPINLDQVFTALVTMLACEWADRGESPADQPEAFAVECITRALADVMGSTKPKVTGVTGLAATCGHRGDDQLAAVFRSAIGKTSKTFNRVKVEYRPDAA